MVPKISIIFPVYNGEKYLRESINSILSQTFESFELILINDCSADGSQKIINEFAKRDKRIVLINNQKNIGLPKTLNKGLESAKGKYIARMDQDDISLEDRLKVQYNYLERHPNIFLIGSSAVVIDEAGRRMGVFEKYDNYKKIKKKLLKSNPIVHPSIMFRNKGELFYREKFKTSSEDYDLYLRLLSRGEKITNLPNFLIKYRIGRDSLCSTSKDQQFYFQKAKELYLQREKFGKDNYESVKPSLEKQEQQSFDKLNLNTRILTGFQDNQMRNVRKNIRLFFKNYGINKNQLIIYVLSFIPYSWTKFIKKFFV